MRQIALKIPALMMLSIFSSAAVGDPIQWAADLEQARAIAAQTNKPLLVHFWTPDCGPCKIVESKVFTVPMVAQAINDHFVPLKVNAYTQEDLRLHFNVRQWPTDIISTVDGKVLHRMVTEQNPNRYVHKLTSIAQQNAAPPAPRSDLFSQSPQVQPNPIQRSKWDSGIPNADTANNASFARRPGIDPSKRPGFDKSMQSAINLSQQRFSDEAANTSRYESSPNRFEASRSGNRSPTQSDQFASHGAGAEQHPAELTNRFAASSPNFERANDPRGQVITNPYSSGRPASAMSAATPGNSQLVTNPAASIQTTQANRAENATWSQSVNSPPPSRQEHFVQQQRQVDPVQVQSSLGLDGRCPVTLISQGKWRKGDQRWGAIHRGKTYLFAGPEEQQVFLASPDDYSPVLAGMDVVQLADHGQVVEGTRRFGVLYDDDGVGADRSRIYLFDSAESRNQFEIAPERFLRPVMQAIQQGRLDTLLR